MARAAALLLIVLIAASPAQSAGAPDYVRSGLKLSGPLVHAATGDMNGDGLSDVASVCLKGDPKTPQRVAEIFLQKKGGGFPAKPDYSMNLSPDAAAFDLGDVTGTGVKSLCYLAPDGLYAYLPGAGGPQTKPAMLVKRANVFSKPDPRDLPHWEMFVPDGRGGAEVALVPGVNSLGIYRRGAGGYSLEADAQYPVKTRFSGGHKAGGDSSLTVSHKLPVVSSFTRKSGSPDIVMALDDTVLVYRPGAAGKYSASPAERFEPGLLKPGEDGPADGAWTAPLDVNGDGRLDFIVTKKTGGVIHTKSLVFVYTRNADGTLPAKPGSTIITEGVVGPRFVDLNGDGRLDIMLPSVKVGISNFINMLTSSQVNVDVAMYLQGADGRYADAPTKSKSVDFKLDLSNIMRATPVLEEGGFSGEMSYGLAVVTKDDLVSIYLPDKYSILSDRPRLEIKVEGPTGMVVGDLNGDGTDDILMTYAGSDKSRDRLNVFVSR